MYNYSSYYSVNTGFIPDFSTGSYNYWERSFFQRARGIWKVEGLPQAAPGQVQTDKDAFLWGLFHLGYLTVFETKQYGITFQPSAPHGVGLQFEPWGMTVATPYFSFSRPLVIGQECENIKLTPDYTGIWDIIDKYAAEMQAMDIAVRQQMINARFAYIAAADNDKEKRSMESLFEKIENGDPYIIYNRSIKKAMPGETPELPWAQFDRDLSKNFILPELLEARRNVITAFYREMGVPVASDKKERENQIESSVNTSEFFNRRQVWQDCLDESCDRVNRMFGTEIQFTYSGEEMEKDAILDSETKPLQSSAASDGVNK